MIVHRRAPRVWVFGVDHDAIQVCWRALEPGTLELAVAGQDGPVVIDLDAPAPGSGSDARGMHRCDAGAATIEGLSPGRSFDVRATAPGLRVPVVMRARTLDPLTGDELARVATVSDLHVGTEVFGHRSSIREEEDHSRPHPLRCTEAALEAAAAWGADRVVAKGDLTNTGQVHQWRDYASLVHASTVPVDAVAGNHDSGAFGGPQALAPSDAAQVFDLSIALPILVRDLPGVRVVLADTTIPGRNLGTIAPVADDIVDAAAEAPRHGSVLVLLHHQLQPRSAPEGWPLGVPHHESIEFLDRLGSAHPNVLVSSGHTHRNRRWSRAGVTVTQVGSTKDYPGVWAGYRVHEGGISQTLRRVERADCVSWTDRSRTAAYGLWEHASPGRLDARCFNVSWAPTTA